MDQTGSGPALAPVVSFGVLPRRAIPFTAQRLPVLVQPGPLTRRRAGAASFAGHRSNRTGAGRPRPGALRSPGGSRAGGDHHRGLVCRVLSARTRRASRHAHRGRSTRPAVRLHPVARSSRCSISGSPPTRTSKARGRERDARTPDADHRRARARQTEAQMCAGAVTISFRTDLSFTPRSTK